MTTVNLQKDYLKNCNLLGDIPRDLKNCRCCSNHRERFPTLGSILPHYEPNKIKVQKECKCPCRHIAREFCRKWDFINEVEDISSEEELSEDSDSSGSLKDFIVKDKMSNRTRNKLNSVLSMFKQKN